MSIPEPTPERRRSTLIRATDPFALQVALSRAHARLVPMQHAHDGGYELDPSARDWCGLPAHSGFFDDYGLRRALRMLLDVLRALTALHDTRDAAGRPFTHGEVAVSQFRIDPHGVCRLVPLTARHASTQRGSFTRERLSYFSSARLLEEPLTPRADVFSVGVLLWEALAGRRLFVGTANDATNGRIARELPRIPQLRSEFAWATPLESMAARALLLNPSQRVPDCAELWTTIACAARGRVASHAEIADYFGQPMTPNRRAAAQRLIPRRSTTLAAPTPADLVLGADSKAAEPERDLRAEPGGARPWRAGAALSCAAALALALSAVMGRDFKAPRSVSANTVGTPTDARARGIPTEQSDKTGAAAACGAPAAASTHIGPTRPLVTKSKASRAAARKDYGI